MVFVINLNTYFSTPNLEAFSQPQFRHIYKVTVIHSFIHLSKYLLSVSYALGT